MPRFHLVQPVDAPRDIAWSALSDARGLAGWQADEVEGIVAPGQRLRMSWPALAAEVEVEVLELDAPNRVRFAWRDTDVTFEVADGGVTLASSNIEDLDEYEGSGSAWAVSLATLAHFCEAHAGARREVAWLVAPVRASAEMVHMFFTDESALGTWLGQGEPIGPAGGEVHRRLAPGVELSGRVLSNTPGRDVLVSWEQDGDSVLALRTLKNPQDPQERLLLFGWSRWTTTPPLDSARAALELAHHRLTQLLGSRRLA